MNTPQYKLEVLRHYQACGSIAATAEHYGISRQSIYTWDRQHREKGEAGLQNGSRAHRSHKHQTPPDTVEKIRQLALQNPTLGGTQLAKLIVAPFTRVSAQTVNGVLRQLRLSDADDRWREIEGHLRACPM